MSEEHAPASRPGPGARAAMAAVRWYQVWISPNLMPSCRFHPSCSAYSVEAFSEHGLVRGLGLTVWRLLRCAPWHPGGWDPVPPRRRHRGDGVPPSGTEPDPEPEHPSTDPPRTEGLSRGTDR
ncbi:membrane protein insertion efficiency factor YidD [Pseudonocardia spirodelae]|uniref:Putative membrane protein insertion efficiency factor n=1 Tax=Pseudonocardia spirodelae TaxID=3133431 RepID=A0ABU8TDA7_9PSEU